MPTSTADTGEDLRPLAELTLKLGPPGLRWRSCPALRMFSSFRDNESSSLYEVDEKEIPWKVFLLDKASVGMPAALKSAPAHPAGGEPLQILA